MMALVLILLVAVFFVSLTFFLDGAGPCPRCGRSVSWGCRCRPGDL